MYYEKRALGRVVIYINLWLAVQIVTRRENAKKIARFHNLLISWCAGVSKAQWSYLRFCYLPGGWDLVRPAESMRQLNLIFFGLPPQLI